MPILNLEQNNKGSDIILNQRESELANQRYVLLSQKVQIDKALGTIEIQLQEVQRLKQLEQQKEEVISE